MTAVLVPGKAGMPTADRVVIATNRDDTAVLAPLTACQLNPSRVVVASIRESENEPLLLRSGIDAVATSSEAVDRTWSGRAFAHGGQGFTDLLIRGDGLELVERNIHASEVGRSPTESEDPVIAVIRSGHVMTCREVTKLHATDRLVVAGSKPRASASERHREPFDDDHGLQGLG